MAKGKPRFNRYFEWLFSPATSLMTRLNFSRKSTLLAIIALLAFSVITINLYNRLNKVIETSEQGLVGLSFLPPLFKTVQLMQQHRGLSAGLLSGSAEFKTRLSVVQEEMTNSFNLLKETLPLRLTSTALWQQINKEITLTLKQGLDLSIKENFSKHTDIVKQLFRFSHHIADEYALTNHPDLESYYLINTALHQLVPTQEYLGQVRAFGTGLLSKKHSSAEQLMHLYALKIQADETLYNLNLNLKKTGEFNPSIQKSLSNVSRDIFLNVEHIFELVETDLIQENYQSSPKYFYNTATMAINATYFTLLQILLPSTETLIEKRLSEANNALFMSLAVALLILLLLLYFSVGIYIATIKTINSISHATLSLNKSVFSNPLESPDKNKLQPLENNFDTMARELTHLVNQSKQDKARIHAIIDSSLDALVQMDANGIISGWSHQAEAIFGWSATEIIGKSLHETIIPERYRDAHNTGFRRFLRTKEEKLIGNRVEIEALHRNGHEIPVELTITTIETENGFEFNAFINDITKRKKAEAELQMLARVFSDSHQGITITDQQGTIINVNPAFSSITGYSREEAIGENPRILSSGKHDKDFYKAMWEAISTQEHWKGEVWNKKKNGELYAEFLTISTVRSDDGEVLYYVAIFSDITESKEHQKALELMAHYDVLTQLPNRVLFSDRFSQAIAHSKRKGSLLAVCFLDLDNFKPINDRYGHSTGDKLLIEVSQRIKTSIREEDTVSRQGGDEFALLLGDIESIVHCEQLLDRIHAALAEPYIIDGHTHTISASSGVTLYPQDNSDLDTLLRHSDQAMYQAKLTGRNTFNFFDVSKDDRASEKHYRLQEIKKALFDNQFCLYYQPKVNMKTGLVFGVEALIRWQHPEKGLIPPLDFLPVIDNTDVEIQLGNWVILNAIEQLSRWNEQGIDFEVSVNISSLHLQSLEFIDFIQTCLERFPKINPSSLQLEIVESSSLGDLDSIRQILKTCREKLGVSIALDDFGTGYSSLTHLRNLPADTIKVDQSFVRDMLNDPSDHSIIDGVIGLADSFNRKVIAEGVESHAHGLALLIMGCELAQGYAIARPMPANEVADWLDKYIPNQQWIDCAKQNLSFKERSIKLVKITTENWFSNFENRILSSPDEDLEWPIADHNKCHHGVWIQRSRQDKIFNTDALNKLDQAHQSMHMLANNLIIKYQSGKLVSTKKGVDKVRTAVAEMTTILEQLK